MIKPCDYCKQEALYFAGILRQGEEKLVSYCDQHTLIAQMKLYCEPKNDKNNNL